MINIDNIAEKAKKENDWSQETWLQAKQEYMRFLTLRKKYPHETLAPSNLMDGVWHIHILNTQQYFTDCDTLFGRYLHHVPHLESEPSEENEETFRTTQALYQREFGEPMVTSSAARCDGKPCHVPSECRCR
jgi:hypothetical protein